MSTTYVNLVNHVMRRLREDEVSSVSNTTYSTMVGDFVNDAKRHVEDAHDWSALRATITVSTSDGTAGYTLTDSGDRIKVINATNDTSNWFMRYQNPTWMESANYISSAANAPPEYYTFNGVDSSQDSKVQLYPIPDGTYSIRFNLIKRPEDLSSDSDTVDIPFMPIVHQAIALLARERGETGGTSAAEYFAIASQYLSDAIAHDAYKNPEEFIFRTA